MPKMKTHRAAAKRFKITGTGKVKRTKANRRHLLTSKNRDRKRGLRMSAIVHSANMGNVRKLLTGNF